MCGIDDNPVFELNRIVALSYAEGPETALKHLQPIAHMLRQYQPFHAVAADLYARTGHSGEAKLAYRLAHDLSQTEAERLFFLKKLGRFA